VTESERAGPLLGLAERLWNAEVDHAPISPLSDARPGLLPEEAYAVIREAAVMNMISKQSGNRDKVWKEGEKI